MSARLGTDFTEFDFFRKKKENSGRSQHRDSGSSPDHVWHNEIIDQRSAVENHMGVYIYHIYFKENAENPKFSKIMIFVNK